MRICFVGIIASILLPVLSFAKDSVWVVGNNQKVAISVFEHRADADKRAAEITLIIGSWFLSGQVKDSGQGYVNPAPVTLKTKDATFKGTISVDFSKNLVTLKGKLTLNGEPFDLNEKLPVKELQGL